MNEAATGSEREVFRHLDNKDWDQAIESGKKLPYNWDIWQRLPSYINLPNEAAHKIMDHLSRRPELRDNLNSFLFEYAHNLPANASKDVLRRAAEFSKNSNLERQKFLEHPNYEPTPEDKRMSGPAAFWQSYERNVRPQHFAAIKSHFSGKPEEIEDHRGAKGSSHDNNAYITNNGSLIPNSELQQLKPDQHRIHDIIPHLNDYAKKVQAEIMKDEYIKKRMFNNEPYVKLYRGVGGHYGNAIKQAVNHDPDTREVDRTKITVPTAHLTSWTTDPEMAQRFAYSRGSIEGQPNHHGVIMEKWIPVKHVLHSGHHDIYPGQEHAHPDESEIVVGHPHGSITIDAKNLKFQNAHENMENKLVPSHEFHKPNPRMKKSEDLDKGLNGDWKKEGYTLHYKPHPQDESYFEIHAHDKNGNKVGEAKFVHHNNRFIKPYHDGPAMDSPPAVRISEYPTSHKRKGLATAMYAMAEKATGKKIRNIGDKYRTTEGQEFWSQPKRTFGKFEIDLTQDSLKKVEEKFKGIQGFRPARVQPYSIIAAEDINREIQLKHIHDLSHFGHFTKNSFIVGYDPTNSWLMKLEPKNRPAIKSVKGTGPQVVKEAAFYNIAYDVFGLASQIPHACLGSIDKDGQPHHAVAIKMLPDDFKLAQDLEGKDKRLFKDMLEKFVQDGTVHKIATMFYILGEGDSHSGNVMTNGVHMQMIDHGSSFANAEFDPSKDDDIFIPYILRSGKVRSSMTKEEKLKNMPKIRNAQAQADFKQWLLTLDEDLMRREMVLFGLDPRPAIERMDKIKELIRQSRYPDAVINSIWVYGLNEVENAVKPRNY